ncbi:hypothetical protein HOLleu_23497 [Holothuria leucospilota]|uniref:Uncharacterized protein n=1 Tax=Holothuria leucospilota TaxID=206669 RepID=A0A9Q1BUA5_HOLLE|nr:hypothetical protein HOLleu_23497 [Holothuria leucospilota]
MRCADKEFFLILLITPILKPMDGSVGVYIRNLVIHFLFDLLSETYDPWDDNTNRLDIARIIILIAHTTLTVVAGSIPSNENDHITTQPPSSPETIDHYVSIRDMMMNILLKTGGDYNVPMNRFRGLRDEINGLRDCPAIQDREVLCPSLEYEDHDHNRRPSIIVHSICHCTGCAIGKCIEHTQALKVMRRQNETAGFYPDWEVVSLACYCTKNSN